jgi:hypothetical protein
MLAGPGTLALRSEMRNIMDDRSRRRADPESTKAATWGAVGASHP